MNQPQAKHSGASAAVAKTQSAPASSNKGAVEVDVALIDGIAYPINKGETMLAFLMRQVQQDRLLRGLWAIVVCATTLMTKAQLVFIPDVQMREWLNMVILDVVDADGYMNTAHPSIPYLTHVSMSVDWDPVDLTGLEYLTSVDTLLIHFNEPAYTAVAIPALPSALSNLTLNSFPGADLPDFPSTLKSLDLYAANSITSIPSLPPDLEHFSIYAASALTSIAPMPSSMHLVGLGNLTSLTDLSGILPDTITGTLNLENLPLLTDLPPFPHFEERDTLLLANLQLQSIPSFPAHISLLNLWMLPMVDSLPTFPADLERLEVLGLDNLEALPPLPSTTYYIALSGLPLVSALPTLPDALNFLHVQYAPMLECLPTVPPNASIVNVFYSGVECIPNIPAGLSTNLPLCSFYNAGNCVSLSPSVSGTVYHDLNGNGARDAGETGVRYATVDIDPSSTITGVVDSGFYAQALNAGTYTINAVPNSPYVTSISPASHAATLVNVSDVDSLNDFGVVLQTNVQDLVVHVIPIAPARPGFNNLLRLSYGNQGTVGMDGSVSLTFDDDQDWISSSPAPDLLVGHTATWNFTDLPIGEQRLIDIWLHTDPAVLIGTPISHTAVADPLQTDQTPADNEDNVSALVVGSYDPNDKSVWPAEMTSDDVASGERLTYIIRFQNTGTYSAERVIITDTLSTDLQWNTMHLLVSSHPCTWFIQDGTLSFTFEPIVLPDSTTDEPGSHGFVTFSIVPNTMLTNGMQVGNTANIYFDFNAPVVTNEALLTVSDPQGIASWESAGPVLSPNPVRDILRIDALSGSRSALSVLDATGRPVMATQVSGPTALLDVSALPSGAYQVRLDAAGVVGRFVKY